VNTADHGHGHAVDRGLVRGPVVLEHGPQGRENRLVPILEDDAPLDDFIVEVARVFGVNGRDNPARALFRLARHGDAVGHALARDDEIVIAHSPWNRDVQNHSHGGLALVLHPLLQVPHLGPGEVLPGFQVGVHVQIITVHVQARPGAAAWPRIEFHDRIVKRRVVLVVLDCLAGLLNMSTS
jgi:hypothetical protein